MSERKMTFREEAAAAGLAAIGLGAAVYLRHKTKKEQRKKKKLMTGEPVRGYRNALSAYINQVAEDKVTLSDINMLYSCIEIMEEAVTEKELGQIFAGTYYTPVIEIIYDYTRKMAGSIPVEAPKYRETTDLIRNMKYYLEIQREALSRQ